MATRDMLQKVLDERAKVWEQAKALNDTVLGESRDYSAEENEQYERMSADLSRFDERIRDLTGQVEQENRADEARSLLDHDPRPSAGDNRDEAPSDDDVIRQMARGEVRAHEFRAPEKRATLTAGTDTAGGNTVPTSFFGQLIAHLIENSAIRQTNVTVLSTASGEDLQVPKTTSHSSASIVAEAATISASDPAFGQVTLGAYKYGFLVQVASELLADTAVDLTGYLAMQGGRALANGSGAHFISGTGSGQPNGIVTAATVGVTAASATAITVDELIDLQHSVIAPYRRRGAWFGMNDSTLAAVRKLKDSNDQYLWQPSVQDGVPDRLLNSPLYIDPNFDDQAIDAKPIVYGDHSGYHIRDVASARIERSDDFAFDSDLSTWRFLFRTDGDLVDSNSVKVLQNAAA